MTLFGGRLPVTSLLDLLNHALQSAPIIRLELCPCKELGKFVVRVAGVRSNRDWSLLVDTNSAEYFVAAHSISAIRSKIERLLRSALNRFEIVSLESDFVRLFPESQ